MSMVVQHNMAALNANRMLGVTTSAQSKSTEKLSSGYKINRAADDAAGLSISEKMRSQIRGLNKASANAQDGISLVQTAEGALNETESILQRMRELAVQASNGTETNDDRDAINNEITQLQDEITRISETTQFNTMNLLDGSLAGPKGVSASGNVTTGAIVAKTKSAALTTASAQDMSSFTLAKETINVDGVNIDVDWTKLSTDDQAALKKKWTDAGVTDADSKKAAEIMEKAINDAIAESNYKLENVKVESTSKGVFKITSGSTGTDSSVTSGIDTGLVGKLAGATATAGAKATGTTTFNGENTTANDTLGFTIDGQQLRTAGGGLNTITNTTSMETVASKLQTALNAAITAHNANLSDDEKIKDVTVTATSEGRLVVTNDSGVVTFDSSDVAKNLGLDASSNKMGTNGGMTLQIGANEGQTMNFGIDDMSSEALGVGKGKVDLSTQESAEKAITTIDEAIKKVSAQRSALGAVQNRLEHTISNLDNIAENTQSAESAIRDTDMATEMVNYSKNNILAQAGQSMLAQANQSTQGVLSLLG